MIHTSTYPMRVAELFGGPGRGAIRRMARRTGLAERTVYAWVERGLIPAERHRELFALAKELGVPLKPEHLVDLPEDWVSPCRCRRYENEAAAA